MLWLTGMLGVLAVGAVSFLDLSVQEEAEEDEPGFDDFIDENGLGDLTATLESLNSLPAESDASEHGSFDAFHLADITLSDHADGDGDTDELEAFEDILDQVDTSWMDNASAADLEAFNVAEDDLVLVWDDSTDEEPSVTLSQNVDSPDLMDIKIGDDVMAQVPAESNVTSDNIALIPLSAAQSIGWADS
ncbi:MAG: hypothetical protein ABJL99_12970 [Aliishimia sp.]